MHKLVCFFLFKFAKTELTGILKLADSVLERVKKSSVLNLADTGLIHNIDSTPNSTQNTNLIGLPSLISRSHQIQDVSLYRFQFS